MSEKLGMINYGSDDDEVFIGRDLAHTRSYGERVASDIDSEVKRIIDECYAKAKEIILAHEDILHKCAALLIEKERSDRKSLTACSLRERRDGVRVRFRICTPAEDLTTENFRNLSKSTFVQKKCRQTSIFYFTITKMHKENRGGGNMNKKIHVFKCLCTLIRTPMLYYYS